MPPDSLRKFDADIGQHLILFKVCFTIVMSEKNFTKLNIQFWVPQWALYRSWVKSLPKGGTKNSKYEAGGVFLYLIIIAQSTAVVGSE
jgi:hypothetical protein